MNVGINYIFFLGTVVINVINRILFKIFTLRYFNNTNEIKFVFKKVKSYNKFQSKIGFIKQCSH